MSNPFSGPVRVREFLVLVLLFGPLLEVAAQVPVRPEAPDLSGRWDSVGWFGGFDPAPPYGPAPLNAEGLAMKSVYRDETDNPVYECIGPGVPSVLIVPYMLEITQSENEVILHHEYFDTVRTVRLNEGSVPGDIERTIYGHSTGWYEGNSLVVETRGFAFDRIGADMNGGPSGENKMVTEKYTRSADGQTLHVEFVIEDPDYLTEPYVREREYRYAPDQELYPFECEPEIAGKTREMYSD